MFHVLCDGIVACFYNIDVDHIKVKFLYIILFKRANSNGTSKRPLMAIKQKIKLSRKHKNYSSWIQTYQRDKL